MQFYIEECIQTSLETHELAHKAYTSYIRSYSTYSTDLKAIFYIKNLHLGHVAKSFGLRESPSELKSENNHNNSHQRPERNGPSRRPQSTMASFNKKNSQSDSSNEWRTAPPKKKSEPSSKPGLAGLGGLLRRYNQVSEFDSGLGRAGNARKTKFSLNERMKRASARNEQTGDVSATSAAVVAVKPGKIKKIKKNMSIFD